MRLVREVFREVFSFLAFLVKLAFFFLIVGVILGFVLACMR